MVLTSGYKNLTILGEKNEGVFFIEPMSSHFSTWTMDDDWLAINECFLLDGNGEWWMLYGITSHIYSHFNVIKV